MARLDFNRGPVQQSGYENKAKNKNKTVLLEPGTYLAYITKYERLDSEKGMSIKLTFGVWKRHEGFIAFITKWMGLGYKGDSAAYAFEDAIKISDALNIPRDTPCIFDNEVGISPEEREKYILMKKVMIHIERGEGEANGNKFPVNKIIGFSPYAASSTSTPVEERREYSPTPTNNPEEEYASKFGGNDNIPF